MEKIINESDESKELSYVNCHGFLLLWNFHKIAREVNEHATVRDNITKLSLSRLSRGSHGAFGTAGGSYVYYERFNPGMAWDAA